MPHDVHEAAFPSAADAAIVGAGVCGLAIGWRLAQRGLKVAIFERERAGAGASHAATGMLAAAAEVEPGEDDLLPLLLESQRLWPTFRDEVEAASGRSIDYRADGVLVVALGREEVERLRFRFDLQQRLGLATEWLGGGEARRREPGLRPAVSAAISCPGDHQVEARLLVAALAKAFVAAGGILLENCSAERLETAGGRVAGVVTGQGTCRAATVVLAAGAWSAALPGLPAEAVLPVRPLKGQSLALRMPVGAPTLGRMVWTEQVYLAPKSDGRLIVGATVEEKGFDDSLTAGGVYALLDGARRALPGIEELAIDEIWCGFRPSSRDDAPILGETALPGLVVATGHHRNGILLAPVTAQAIADLVLDGAMRGPAAHFTAARFAPAPRAEAAE
ncbi:MAG TPA: glycine oxidase ThiO [Hyphomicrobiales bacterium]|nr:glycine oxidase ThiO [Hyphomicrobiales bacterium]